MKNAPLPHPCCRLSPHAPREEFLRVAAGEGFFPRHMIQDAGGESFLEQRWAQKWIRWGEIRCAAGRLYKTGPRAAASTLPRGPLARHSHACASRLGRRPLGNHGPWLFLLHYHGAGSVSRLCRGHHHDAGSSEDGKCTSPRLPFPISTPFSPESESLENKLIK